MIRYLSFFPCCGCWRVVILLCSVEIKQAFDTIRFMLCGPTLFYIFFSCFLFLHNVHFHMLDSSHLSFFFLLIFGSHFSSWPITWSKILKRNFNRITGSFDIHQEHRFKIQIFMVSLNVISSNHLPAQQRILFSRNSRSPPNQFYTMTSTFSLSAYESSRHIQSIQRVDYRSRFKKATQIHEIC